jgi:hypothetical protein
VYKQTEVIALLGRSGIAESVSVLLAMMLYLGVREGEACGPLARLGSRCRAGSAA